MLMTFFCLTSYELLSFPLSLETFLFQATTKVNKEHGVTNENSNYRKGQPSGVLGVPKEYNEDKKY